MPGILQITVRVFMVVVLSTSMWAQVTNTFPSSGNVGIGTGTSTPPMPLTISSPNGVGSGLGIAWNRLNGSSGETDFYNYGQAAGGGFTFYNYFANGGAWPTASPQALVTINSSGYVGVGTTSPPMPLTISSPNGQGSGLGIAWNRMNGSSGETDFYNYGQAAGGGFTFYNYYANGGVWPTGSPQALLTINASGYVGIGTTTPQHLLHVTGTIGAEEVIVSPTGADYVFDPDYHLAPLTEVAAYISENHHLPDIPSATEIHEKGIGVGEMQSKLLAKIEELTLHMIQADQNMRRLQERNTQLEKEIHKMRGMGQQ